LFHDEEEEDHYHEPRVLACRDGFMVTRSERVTAARAMALAQEVVVVMVVEMVKKAMKKAVGARRGWSRVTRRPWGGTRQG